MTPQQAGVVLDGNAPVVAGRAKSFEGDKAMDGRHRKSRGGPRLEDLRERGLVLTGKTPPEIFANSIPVSSASRRLSTPMHISSQLR